VPSTDHRSPSRARAPRRWLATLRRAGTRIGLAATLLTLVACAPAPVAGGGYRLVFHDDFDGDAVGGIWATAPFGGSLPATVRNGALTLTTTAANDYYWAYVASTGPRLDTEPSYPFAGAWQEGYFEARIRYSDNRWARPAFWLFSMAKTEAWPGENCARLNAEWDIMENGIGGTDGDRPASRWSVSVIHRNTTDNTPDGYCGQPDETRSHSQEHPDTNLSGWHVWAGRWTADELCTYLDGVEIHCMEPYDSTRQPMHIVFTMLYLRTCAGCPARPASLEMQVDWVRVWQR
jgi:beta-glucanase (GH16 family)